MIRVGKSCKLALAMICIALLSILLPAGSVSTPAHAAEVDLEIVLAVDGSGSVDAKEFKLQLGGIAAAFRDQIVQHAMLSGPRRKVAVAVLVWSDSAFPKYPTPWFVLDTPQSAHAFADFVETFHHKAGRTKGIGGGGTAIGDAIVFSIAMMNTNGMSATRRVIDVSGDGVETPPWFGTAVLLPKARLLADKHNVTVNGLAVVNDVPDLDDYYRRHMITGAGSFVIVARDYVDFKRAINKKLYREFSSPIAGRDGPFHLKRAVASAVRQ